MAVSSQDILNFLLLNPDMSDFDIATAMETYGVTPAMMAQAVGIPVQQVQQRYEEVKPQGLFTVQEQIKAPEPVYSPEPAPEPVYANPTYTDPFYEDITSVAPTYVAPEPVAQPILTQPVITPEPVVPPVVSLETPVTTPAAQTKQEATTMAYTSQQIVEFLLKNPDMTDDQIVKAMETYKITPAQMATAVGLSEGAVGARIAATVPQGSSVTLGDTVIVPQYQTTGSGMDQQVGALESFASSKTTGDINYKAPVGTPVNVYSADGEFLNTVKTKKDQSFIGGLVDAFKDPVVLAALGGAAYSGLLGGAATGAGSAFEALNAGATAMTDLGAFELANAGASALTDLGAFELANAGTGAFTPTFIPPVTPTGLLTPPVVTGVPPVVTPPVVTPPVVPPTGVPPVVPPTGVPPVVPPIVPPVVPSIVPPVVTPPTVIPPAITAAATSLIPSAVKSLFTPTNIGNLVTSGAQTAAGLLQQQTSREAAQRAQQMIDAETAAAKQSAAFRPIGMTTRFGTSQFAIDPTTGQLTSAGYTLSPEAKNAQDRLVKLAESGLQQAEGAQQAFAPLQTGAQSLFGLGNKYLAQNPQDVAQNYLNQQMALLQPGRELELANLQNRLQQQGRGGLSVAQGGSYGATTPELQALYNARAMQEAQLAAQAQQAGQQQVTFGAGLLGQGASAMGQYYGGQQAAYAPYTTALGQVQGLETAAQQPFSMSAALAQQAAQAGSNVGQLGLGGAKLSTALATSPAATTNPYSTVLGGLGASPAFGQVAGGLLGGGLSGLQSMFSNTGLGASGFGSGLSYGNQDLGLFL
jgi:hypothetical protein